MRATAPTSFVRNSSRRIAAGFTIVELAVTMVVIAILLGSILVPLNTQVESRKYDETQRALERAREALLGFAAANGRFPCPASATSNGLEHFSGTGNPNNGRCHASVTGTNVFAGYLPAATLGLTQVDDQGYALDAWGLSPFNRIRYAISSDSVNGISRPFTSLPNVPPASPLYGMRNAGMANISGTALLYVCASGTGVVIASDCGSAVTLTSNAIVVIWSIGPNAATTNGTSTDESENLLLCGTATARACDRVFVSKIRSGGTAGEYDDSVTWIGSATIFNRLIQAGQLP